MNRWLLLIALTMAASALSGCGEATSKPAGPASQEDIRKDLEEQKKVEEAERGTPVVVKKKR